MIADAIKRSLKQVEGPIKGRVGVHIHPHNLTVMIYLDGKSVMQLPPAEGHKLAAAIYGASVAATGMRRESLIKRN